MTKTKEETTLKSWKEVKVGDVLQNVINKSTWIIQSIVDMGFAGIHIDMICRENGTCGSNVAPAKHYIKI